MTKTTRLIVGLSVLLAATAGGYGFWRQNGQTDPQQRYKTQPVDRGEIVQTVSANGTLQPVVVVNVGTQVSGTVKALHSDFNQPVKPGQVLAELDPALFNAQAEQSLANVANAQSALRLAETRLTRTRQLVERNFLSRAELDQVNQAQESARAQLALAQAQLARDRTNLRNAVIRSPIAGVVVARNIDLGQTVAASFQTPVLFQIAKDLREMQIETSISEADIGNIRIGQAVSFMVDAFQDKEFHGQVKQIRLSPTVQQNVVTYNVIVAADNSEGRLMPGMTAHVRITVNRKSDVLRIPNAALRFRPSEEGDPPNAAPSAEKSGREAGDKRKGRNRNSGMVHVLADGKAKPVTIRTGSSDGQFTEILDGALQPGDVVILREQRNREKTRGEGGNFRVRLF